MFSESDLAAVQGAIARGERTVEFNDRRVTYRTIDELLAAESHIKSELTGASGGRTRSKQTMLVGDKGL